MSDDRVVETTNQPHTTIIERRGGGGGILIGLALLIAVLVGAFYLLNQSRNETVKTDAVATAADKVGSAAEKAGDAIEGTTK